ncbi:hypothetical protein F5Y19DRAFT_48267 [Xylariaceae sp. FL1651]|nr:hypothetical protein F5Y19DRAFT_48267 [Xylariaceae sp. FL1651]
MMDALQRALPANLYASKVGTVIGVSTLFAVIAVVAVILRFKCRSMVKAKIGIDDWLILAALPIAIADAITVSYTTRAGLGRHVEVVPASDLAQGGKLFFTVQLLWIFSSGLVKLSILAFYLRIFSVLTYVRACAWFLIGITTAWLISMPIAHGLQCIPVEKIWDSTVPGHCLDTVLLYLIGSIVDVVVDFLILLLPIPAIFKLQMPMPKKLSVLIIFIIGGLTCVLSLIRFTGAYSVIYNRADLTCK